MKPTDNIPEWADGSNAGNYVGGPFAGQPRKVSIPAGIAAEGFRPGADDPSAAEHVNDYLNMASKLLRWVFAGTSAAVASATIVERNAFGTILAQAGSFFSSLVENSASLSSQAPAFAAGNALLLYAEAPNEDVLIKMTHDNGGNGILFDGGTFASATCSGDNVTGIVVTTSGESSVGLVVSTGGDTADAVIISTAGDGADGLEIYTSGDASDGVRVTASGVLAIGVHAQVNSTTSIAVQGIATTNGTGAKFFGGTTSGIGCIIEAFSDDGLQVTGGLASNEAAVRATGKGAAIGVIAKGGPTIGSLGLSASGGLNGGSGLAAEGTGSGTYGVSATGHTWGVVATATGNNGFGVSGEGEIGVQGVATATNGVGVVARTANAAVSSSAAITATATGAAGGVVVEAVNGPAGSFTCTGSGNAARFENTASTKATTVHVARSADPSVHEDGGMWYRDNIGHSVRREGVTRRLYDTAGGMALATAGPSAGTVNDAGTAILTATFAGANIPAVAGTVLVRVVMEIGRNSNASANAIIEIYDETGNGGVPEPIDGMNSDTIRLYQAGGATVFERHLVYELKYLLPAAGARTFTVGLKSSSAVDLINFRHASLTVEGVF